MLESFRSNMKGVALGITILIAVVFIFSGTGTVFLANSSNGAVASVGETEISEFDLLRSMSNHCLLYTSPSPRDQRGARMPASA